MRKIRWEISKNYFAGAKHEEYDRNVYVCRTDDIWTTIETPIVDTKVKARPKA